MTEVTDAVFCRGLTEGRRRTGAISSTSSSEIVIGEWETVVSSSSEITVVEWVLVGTTEGTGATRMTERTGATRMTEGTGAAGVTEATDAVGARGACATEAERLAKAESLRRSNSMKCVYEGRTKEILIFV